MSSLDVLTSLLRTINPQHSPHSPLHLSPCQAGTIPNGITNAFSTYGSYLDLRLNYMSCCGIGFQHTDTYSEVQYSWYNLSAPR